MVAVDTETGVVEIIDYAVVEDGGVLVNPMIVDGQVHGGTGQGVGTTLYEEMPFSADGQPLAPTLADYLLPGATDIPDIRIDHMETPVALHRVRPEGHRRGRCDRPAGGDRQRNHDALKPLGVEVCELPITPRRLLAAIDEAKGV